MAGDQQNATALSSGCLDVLQPRHRPETLTKRSRATPGLGNVGNAFSQQAEVRFQNLFALRFGLIRKTQSEIGSGDAGTTLHEDAHRAGQAGGQSSGTGRRQPPQAANRDQPCPCHSISQLAHADIIRDCADPSYTPDMPTVYRSLYRLLYALATPLGLRQLHRQEKDFPAVADRRCERLGQIGAPPQGAVWLHCASVGEVNAALPLIEALLARPDPPSILLSTLTLSGADHAYQRLGNRVTHRLAPLDRNDAVNAWLNRSRPALALFLETELWPETFMALRAREIPLVLVNARLSRRGLARSRLARPLFQTALSGVSLALAQSDGDAQRFLALGMSKDAIEVTGNLKFDLELPTDLFQRASTLKQRIGKRPCWVAGSTRPGEESTILDAQRRLLDSHPDALLILAPRHPQRRAEVSELIKQAGLKSCRYDQPLHSDHAVLLVDRLGELMACYANGVVALVGGSLIDIGGHNLLEPAALGKPVMAGPYLHQQSASANALDEAGALIRVSDSETIAGTVARCLDDPEYAARSGHSAKAVVEAGRGSLARTLARLEEFGWISAAGR